MDTTKRVTEDQLKMNSNKKSWHAPTSVQLSVSGKTEANPGYGMDGGKVLGFNGNDS